ncbi:MAG: c-type cytochrome biogenesis protein CcmI [Rhodobacter sp.]|nr:c-type cytochrome biogenesis protein CcmI [Rhodobacter sp.]
MFWLALAAAALLSGVWIAWPFLRIRSVDLTSADGAISIYRDQLDEVDRDRAGGLISDAEATAARAEIERRALHAARSLDQGLAISKRAPLTAVSVTLVAAAATLAGYAWLGSPDAPDQPLAARKQEALTRMADAGDLTSQIQLLIQRTQDNPENFEDWWMLARSYAAIGDHASSADAYRHAADLAGDRPAVLSAYAEAMTLANGNKVPGAARLIFEQVARDSADPRARYYVSLARAQTQDFQGAIEGWTALARSSAPGAPWMPLVRRDIVNMARFLEQDVTDYLPDATPTEIAAAGGTGVMFATDRIATLEAQLAKQPKDYKAWIALARAQAVAGERDAATEALAQARQHFAAAPFVLQKISEAERALGLDLVATGPRGPDAEDIAAAAGMTQAERDSMVEGMVAGLAARLEEQPNDPDGWVMLVRSYATLGQQERAREAYSQAAGIFDGNDAVLRALERQAGRMISSD